MIKDIDKFLSDLEKGELETADGLPHSQMYSQLLAIYLFQNELCYAKYLWKRIPINIKNSCSDVRSIWTVAQKMWQRDWPAVHIALNVEWNKNVADIMNALKERIRERAIILISEAYSSLDITTLAKMIGLSPEESRKIAIEKGWHVVGTIIKPHKIYKQQTSSTVEAITEEQLYKLTQFVSFLEN
ncbi:PREDICTED: COP9 signalosome complex subunit 8 [Ceratosolen solmsi marchali]|uniref:COP9 signalosome complex subunit 8 n=1 Tax=Ceratosolen solmsi marchali TaxID=326594 RepID=A0AAJ6YCW7_9HYME|nr:PREDICTED: COP9 signalosome complex subunit 8 [Ceratosolen solmsi marchali]